MCVNCNISSCSSCNTNSYVPSNTSALNYDGFKFNCPAKFTVFTKEPLNNTINTLIKQICINANFVESVTGLNTNNIDPQDPVIQISVDSTTISGTGTPAFPLSTGPERGFTILNPRTVSNQRDIYGISVISPALAGTYKGATDPFAVEIDRVNFLESVVISIETPPAAATGFVFGDGFNGISYPTAQDYTGGSSTPIINTGDSSSFTNTFCFAWASLPIGQHDVLLKFAVTPPVAGIPDQLKNISILVS